MITQEMMKLAVTGTARPSRVTAIAENTAVSARLPPAIVTMMFASLRPSPVRVMTPTMIPAAAITGITESAPVAPAARASTIRRGVIHELRSRKLRTKASPVA